MSAATFGPVYGSKGRIGAVVPANNSVLEPELWSALPPDVALYATRILARGDLTAAAVRGMEPHVDRAIEELAATGVDVIAYCDMVTTFVMDAGWNEAKVAAIEKQTGVTTISAWTALRHALSALGIRRFALGTPYPAALHALARPFFAARGFKIVDDVTLDIIKMADVPKINTERLLAFVGRLKLSDAEAIVLLATDLPSFSAIARIERERGVAVLTSNQTILWGALRALGNPVQISHLGRLFHV
jgi:maleate cis-trans isomerase